MKKTNLLLFVLVAMLAGCNNIGKNNNEPKEYIQQVEVSPFMSTEEMKLASVFRAGAFGLSEYKNLQQEIRRRIDDKIRMSDFSQMDVYTTEKDITKSSKLMRISNNKEKNKLQEFILYATQNNRVIYSIALFSKEDGTNLQGTLITVSPKYNEDGKIKGEMNQGRQIFIPDL